jgi:tetratricopeptide (TPR) repeat protein
MSSIQKILLALLTIFSFSDCFSDKKSKELAIIDSNSNYPNLSLTKWGDPVLLIVDQKFKEAQKEEVSKNFKKALELFNESIDLVIKNESSLFADQYLNILVHLAYCHSDLEEYDKALKSFQIREAILLAKDDWFSKLPNGLKILVKKEYGQPELLAQNSQEMGIVYYRLKEFKKGKEYLTKSNEIYMELGYPKYIIKNYNYLGLLAKEFKNWDDLLFVGKEIHKLKESKEDIELGLHALRYTFEAYVNQNNNDKAKKILKEILAIEKKNNDPNLASDIELLKSL